MGSSTEEKDRSDQERLHRRRIERSFAVATKSVTVRQFQRFLQAHPEVPYKSDKQPVLDPEEPIGNVTLYEAAQYCRWLSEQEKIPEKQMCFPSIEEIEKSAQGMKPLKLPADYLTRTGYRLPTEAEWECACRAGATTSRYFGPDEQLLDRYAWSAPNSKKRAWPVGQKRPNDLGLADMLGNLHQLSISIWESTDTDKERGRAVLDDLPSDYEIQQQSLIAVRGGSWNNQIQELRCASRWSHTQPPWRFPIVGFRLARTCN
jgi:formylglycine-generating enzyme required for sulfatase activity